ncbi:mitochondrial carrier [Paratrimastix pyriformis]|uniref:Membrane carrier 2 n=1 Tax=Paratrimastix pyriformis TaxID=342808 RepID=M4QUY4_9EUKA|nr:membrane carrier 2 [Paratrimastix pyriformis]KAJ4460185.1 mitochondrial carrier [Paratrimastix pyriformis]
MPDVHSKVKGKKDLEKVEPWQSAAAAFVATQLEVMLTYPMNVMNKLQQYKGMSSMAVLTMFQNEGISRVYRGLGTALFTAGTARAVSFGLSKYYKNSDWMPETLPEFAKNIISSALAACSQPLIISPLDNMKTLLQTHPPGFENLGPLEIAAKIYRERGIAGFYRGASRAIQRNIVYMPIFQATRKQVSSMLPEPQSEQGRWAKDFFCGSMGSFVAQFLTFPLQVSRTIAQTSPTPRSSLSVMTSLLREGGIPRLYSGFLPAFVMSLLTGGLFTATEGWALRTILSATKTYRSLQAPLPTPKGMFTVSKVAVEERGLGFLLDRSAAKQCQCGCPACEKCHCCRCCCTCK